MSDRCLTTRERVIAGLVPWPFVIVLAAAILMLMLPRAGDSIVITLMTGLALIALGSFTLAAVGQSLDALRGTIDLGDH